jgi:ABC-type branched-subunit amino acid transport system permease subunit
VSRGWLRWAAPLALAAVFPLVVADPFVHRLAAVAALQAILAVSLNLVLGYGGLIALGHMGFYAIGAYAAALLALHAGAPFALTLPVSGGAAALVAWLLARPILRLRGHYFAMAMVAFSEVVRLVAYNWDSVTRGASGLPGIARPSLLGWTAVTNRDNYYLALVLLVLAVLGVQRFVTSPLGVSLLAARDDDRAAASVGISVAAVRTRALAFAAFVAGAAGAFYAHYTTFVSVEPFLFTHMIEVLAMVAIGGIGTVAGPIVGAVLLTLAPEVLRDLAALRMVLYGILLILVIGLRPAGLAGGWPATAGRLLERWRLLRGRGGRERARGAALGSAPE